MRVLCIIQKISDFPREVKLMYKNVIFDLGGVMVEWAPEEYLMEHFHNADIEKKVFAITFGSPEWSELDAGRITRYAATQKMLARAADEGCAFEVQEVTDDWVRMLRTRRRVVEVAARLKSKGFQLYYLSNIPQDILELLKRRSFWRLFDGGIASCDVGLLKPQPEIYQALLDKYELSVSESIFIDDNTENVKTAYNLGITGIPLRGSIRGLVRNLGVCGIDLH